MGKNRKRKRNQQQQQIQKQQSFVSEFPASFPDNLDYPKNSFLRDEAPYEKSFERALETSYAGFVVDPPSVFIQQREREVQKALNVMEDHGFFRTDITQPFGLGTKCAKTYVTRCLLGEPGTTYKYLGLRMFAHCWTPTAAAAATTTTINTSTEINEALTTISQLNATLTERTRSHLKDLAVGREQQQRGVRGRAKFDIALINCMNQSVHNLKEEPSMGEGKCSVAWHADSSLEHFSTIAVYHLLSKRPNLNPSETDRWSVGLRVAHNAEGPKRGGDLVVNSATPPIAVSLPSGSAYYLLDDFNHHHQHAVIAEGRDPGKRFSSTHRLLRESHNVSHILARCQSACGGFHKKGTKQWRSEQLLLTELESEWIRQFYVQGKQHRDLLWKSWQESIQDLLKYWSLLEERTKQTIDLLRYAAQGRSLRSPHDSSVPSRAERKVLGKCKKAMETVNDLINRAGKSNGEGPSKLLYEPLSDLLMERAKMRELWAKRESDGVFRELQRDQQPLAAPLLFQKMKQQDVKRPLDEGWSPMDDPIVTLRALASELVQSGRVFEGWDLPKAIKPTSSSSSPAPTSSVSVSVPSPSSPYTRSLDWSGWSENKRFGLEMQDPWAGLLLTGKKTIETRTYGLPQALLGQTIEILQSKKGKAGVSSLGNEIEFFGHGNNKGCPVERVGWCSFGEVVEYTEQAKFEADEGRHLVKRDSGYGWKPGVTKMVYGWVVKDFGLYIKEEGCRGIVPAPPPPPPVSTAIRRMRSLFEMTTPTEAKPRSTGGAKDRGGRRRKKKKRY